MQAFISNVVTTWQFYYIELYYIETRNEKISIKKNFFFDIKSTHKTSINARIFLYFAEKGFPNTCKSNIYKNPLRKLRLIDKTDNASVALNFCLYKIKFVFNNVQHIFPTNM